MYHQGKVDSELGDFPGLSLSGRNDTKIKNEINMSGDGSPGKEIVKHVSHDR